MVPSLPRLRRLTRPARSQRVHAGAGYPPLAHLPRLLQPNPAPYQPPPSAIPAGTRGARLRTRHRLAAWSSYALGVSKPRSEARRLQLRAHGLKGLATANATDAVQKVEASVVAGRRPVPGPVTVHATAHRLGPATARRLGGRVPWGLRWVTVGVAPDLPSAIALALDALARDPSLTCAILSDPEGRRLAYRLPSPATGPAPRSSAGDSDREVPKPTQQEAEQATPGAEPAGAPGAPSHSSHPHSREGVTEVAPGRAGAGPSRAG